MGPLISDEQKNLNQSLHETDKNFGNRDAGAGLATHLNHAIIKLNGAGCCNSILDYGTGKGKLVERLRKELPSTIKVSGYDPAVLAWQQTPNEPADLVTCLDVLEHIELNYIDEVLKDIKSLTRRFCYLVIDLQPAVKKMADGRNAHILLAPPEWWVSRVSQLFTSVTSFPVMHKRGIAQKLVIAATSDNRVIPFKYQFIVQMQLFNLELVGGVLGRPKR